MLNDPHECNELRAEDRIVITKHGRPAGVLIGFRDEDDWFEYKLENDPRFLKRIAASRASLRSGKGIAWQDIEAEPEEPDHPERR